MELSVIIPIYNAEKYLAECLSSVAASGINELECILVNDGSKDSSVSICMQYVESDHRFRLIDRSNAGVSSTRNAGLAEATGKYVLFLDADDYMEPSIWSDIMECMNSGYDFAAFSYYTLYSDNSVKEEPFSIPADSCSDISDIRRLVLASSSLNTCWGKLFRLDLIQAHEILFPENLPIGEDFWFVATYFKHCRSALVINRPAVYYRQHPKSAMRAYNMNQRLSYMDILFDFGKDAVLSYHDEALINDFFAYYFRVITNIFLEFSSTESIGSLKNAYAQALQRDSIQEVVAATGMSQLPSYKKPEAWLFKQNSSYLLAAYFKLKAGSGKVIQQMKQIKKHRKR